ncbi:hypothetical protein VHEMI09562 [[Torrubiella] hemipterigena]|uniref:Basic proline-rich protein n=1 Tax=[Torrubiella] hemipterigena TaxID=1531966 RepID=A0A0A1TQ94_9HYPO|nr:hypothetical protein VHEMI09562 [[Torrubiella] hemipterigena]
MEPVPETERMEEFRSSPIPALSLNSPALLTNDFDIIRKLPVIRRGTDPSPPLPTNSAWYNSTTIPYRPRTASPLSGGHARSFSTSNLSATGMSRTQSMPGVNGSGHLLYSPQLRPASPSASPSRVRTPRKPADEGFPLTSPVRSSVLDGERRSSSERSRSPNLGLTSSSSSSRLRRTSSPFRSIPPSNSSSAIIPTTPTSTASSPLYRPYDSSLSSYGSSLSSIPSTPTSTRSRSPSISSLETIPDTPDAEEAALEAERQAAIEAAEGSDSGSESKGKSSLDVPARGRTLGFGSRDKRKRWSVCGAERRSDLDLETIWED